MKYRIEISGTGGELVLGKVKRKFYDFVTENDIDIEEYASNMDFFEENDIEKLKKNVLPFQPGEWFNCDDLGHVTGPSIEDCYIAVTADDKVVHKQISLNKFLKLGADIEQDEEVYPSEILAEGDVYYIGQSFEKGLFLVYEVETESFEPSKVIFITSDYDGYEVINGLSYDGEVLDNLGDMSTTGKGVSHELVLVEGT